MKGRGKGGKEKVKGRRRGLTDISSEYSFNLLLLKFPLNN